MGTSPIMKLDLHIHTTASDGSWSPEKVVRGAVRGGLDVIAIADHDTTAAVAAAQAAAVDTDLRVIPAIELSSTHAGREVHILGYFIDIGAPGLVSLNERARSVREERMREMVARLALQGVRVRYEEVEAAAGPQRVNIGRPHLARALVKGGYASSVPDAFDRLIGDGHPAFVPTRLMTPAEAVALVLEAGGVPVWAHPPREMLDAFVPELAEAGLRGLEVYRPAYSRSDVLRLERICAERGLLRTGGSDWHSPDAGYALGDFTVDGGDVSELLDIGGVGPS